MGDFGEKRNDKEKGLCCTRCGCRHFLVRNTKNHADEVWRYRVCRHCGLVKRTVEK